MSFIKFGKLSATVSSHTLPAPSCFTSPLGVPNMVGLSGTHRSLRVCSLFLHPLFFQLFRLDNFN